MPFASINSTNHSTNLWNFCKKILRTGAHCAFSSNLFHRQIAQIYIDQLSDPENKKCSTWKDIGKSHPQTSRLLSRRGTNSLEARLSQHYIGPQMTFRNVFSAEIWKMSECHFWANVMLRQSRLRASRASPAQNSRVWGWFFPKTFQGLHLVGRCIFELSVHETNLMKKRSV